MTQDIETRSKGQSKCSITCHTQEWTYLGTKVHIFIMQTRSSNLFIKVVTFYLLEMENDARLLDPILPLASKVNNYLFPPLEHKKNTFKGLKMQGARVCKETYQVMEVGNGT